MAHESSLPVEVMPEIIARLPVKTIGRCRCLSKSWYSLIVQPYFINKQRDMSHTVASGEAENHLMVAYRCGVYELMKSSNPRELKFPKEAGNINCLNLIGSSDGLLGLEDLETFVLWNPLFHKFKIIRKSQLQLQIIQDGGYSTYNTLGFGFVPQTCDYKMITFEDVPVGWPQIEIYSLKADAWKMWDGGHSSKNLNRYVWINKNSPLTCVRGKAHGIVRKTMKTIQGDELEEIIILAFDMLEEHFEEIPVPKANAKGLSFQVTDFQDSIALISQPVPRCWEIWLMKDYSVSSSSWTNLYNLYHMDVVPFDIINDGRVILQLDRGTFAVYDPISQIQTKLSEANLCWKWTICKETLALLA